ncbi:hypothetical protein NMY22_g15170 [Coprinellus aureogranulatus]|nr:hypothetical protein NMY22_g15170 [Coprinellus aureogranulatus]
MYPPPTDEELGMLRKLRAEMKAKRAAAVITDDEGDAADVVDILSAIRGSPAKPLGVNATARLAILGSGSDAKENVDPYPQLSDDQCRTQSAASRRKRCLAGVEDSGHGANKIPRTRKDSTAGSRAGTENGDSLDSLHAILARHSSNRDSFNAFKRTASTGFISELQAYVNATSDDEDRPFPGQGCEVDLPGETMPGNDFDDVGLSSATDALTRLAKEPIDSSSEGVFPLGVLSDDNMAFNSPESISASLRIRKRAHSSDGNEQDSEEHCSQSKLSLPQSVVSGLTDFINDSDDDDVPWTPFEPQAESSNPRTFRVVHPVPPTPRPVGRNVTESDSPPASASAVGKAPSITATPSSILRRVSFVSIEGARIEGERVVTKGEGEGADTVGASDLTSNRSSSGCGARSGGASVSASDAGAGGASGNASAVDSVDCPEATSNGGSGTGSGDASEGGSGEDSGAGPWVCSGSASGIGSSGMSSDGTWGGTCNCSCVSSGCSFGKASGIGSASGSDKASGTGSGRAPDEASLTGSGGVSSNDSGAGPSTASRCGAGDDSRTASDVFSSANSSDDSDAMGGREGALRGEVVGGIGEGALVWDVGRGGDDARTLA